MVAIVVTGIITVSAIVLVPAMSYGNLFYVNQQQLRNLALDTLKTMLLDAGYPTKWGSSQTFTNNTVQRFGLALDSSSSFYVLDPDKVSRLVIDNPSGHLGYETIRDRLNLQGYGFNFRIISPFNVTANDGKPVSLTTMRNGVKVLVTYNDGSPIPNALVKAKIIYTMRTGSQTYWATPVSNTTDALGRCMVKCTDPAFQSGDVIDFVLVLTVTVADLATISATYMQGFHQQTAAASIIGDNVTLWIPSNAIPGESTSGERRIMEIASVTETYISTIYIGGDPTRDKMTWGQGYSYLSYILPGLSYEDTLFLIFTIWVSIPGIGRPYILFLGPRPNWMGSRVQAFGDPTGGARGASAAVKVQRNVIISGMVYIAELTLWKESL